MDPGYILGALTITVASVIWIGSVSSTLYTGERFLAMLLCDLCGIGLAILAPNSRRSGGDVFVDGLHGICQILYWEGIKFLYRM